MATNRLIFFILIKNWWMELSQKILLAFYQTEKIIIKIIHIAKAPNLVNQIFFRESPAEKKLYGTE